MELNKQITDTFSVVSLLLAVAAAYLAAIWPIVNELLGDPEAKTEFKKAELRRKRTSYIKALVVLTVFEVLITLLLVPLVIEVVGDWGDHFEPVRAGLLLAMSALVGGFAVTGRLAKRLRTKRDATG